MVNTIRSILHIAILHIGKPTPSGLGGGFSASGDTVLTETVRVFDVRGIVLGKYV
ncbi:9078_t:CDS:2 [Rhizophagus irregularis]|nr:9078_t:CDS:2 [Rhizophagus irregularis]